MQVDPRLYSVYMYFVLSYQIRIGPQHPRAVREKWEIGGLVEPWVTTCVGRWRGLVLQGHQGLSIFCFFPLLFVVIIIGLNKYRLTVLALNMATDADHSSLSLNILDVSHGTRTQGRQDTRPTDTRPTGHKADRTPGLFLRQNFICDRNIFEIYIVHLTTKQLNTLQQDLRWHDHPYYCSKFTLLLCWTFALFM